MLLLLLLQKLLSVNVVVAVPDVGPVAVTA
jgi:hypothetical protein